MESCAFDPTTSSLFQFGTNGFDQVTKNGSDFRPRVGVIWNPKGDGKTVGKANYGSYPWRPSPRSGVPGLNPNAETWTRTYAWVDANNDKVWQPGEEGRLISQVGGASLASVCTSDGSLKPVRSCSKDCRS